MIRDIAYLFSIVACAALLGGGISLLVELAR